MRFTSCGGVQLSSVEQCGFIYLAARRLRVGRIFGGGSAIFNILFIPGISAFVVLFTVMRIRLDINRTDAVILLGLYFLLIFWMVLESADFITNSVHKV